MGWNGMGHMECRVLGTKIGVIRYCEHALACMSDS